MPPVCLPKRGNFITVEEMFHRGQNETQGKRFFKATVSSYVSSQGFCHHLVVKGWNWIYFMMWRPCSHLAAIIGLMSMDYHRNLLLSLVPLDIHTVHQEGVGLYSESGRNILYISLESKFSTYSLDHWSAQLHALKELTKQRLTLNT